MVHHIISSQQEADQCSLFITGELLLFAATALTVLVNMGQLTGNVVSRNIYITSIDARNLGNSLSNTTGSTAALFAADQSVATGAGEGLKLEYYWGPYRQCGGDGTKFPRGCSDSYIGYRWEPLATLESDASATFSSEIAALFTTGYVTEDSRLGLLSRVANVILLVGTILTGLAFLTGFLAHRFCFAFAALECLGAAGCLAVAAAIWTAILVKTRDSIPSGVELTIRYGNGLWMMWGAFAAVSVAIVPLLLACCVGRSKY